MAGRKAYDRQTYLADARLLRRRGLTWEQVADELGISVRTLHRMLAGR